MTIKIHRLSNGSEVWDKYGKCRSVEAPFFIIGAADKASAVQEVMSIADQELNGIPLKEFRVGEFDRDKNLEITAVYERSSGGESQESYETTVSYSGGGGQKHVTTGELVKKVSPSGEDAPDPGSFVNWNGKRGRDFSVAGVDIPTANPRMTITKYFRASEVNSASWQTSLEELVGCVNSRAWRGREPGEVMFSDFSFNGPAAGSDMVAVSFEFQIRKNEKNAKLGDVNMGDVAGWDYPWVITEPTPEGPPKVRGAYVSRVVKYANFSKIGV